MTVSDRWHPSIWVAIAALLLLPLVAMQVTREVRWDARDFAAAAVLLGGGGALYEVAMRFVRGRARRALVGGALAGLVGLLWLQGAVGLI